MRRDEKELFGKVRRPDQWKDRYAKMEEIFDDWLEPRL